MLYLLFRKSLTKGPGGGREGWAAFKQCFREEMRESGKAGM